MIATGTSDNAAHGYNWTFAFPMILFIVVAGTLVLLITRPHRVPGHGPLRPAGDPAESAVEPAGAHRATTADSRSGNVAQDEGSAARARAAPDRPAQGGPDPATPPAAAQPPSSDPEAGE